MRGTVSRMRAMRTVAAIADFNEAIRLERLAIRIWPFWSSRTRFFRLIENGPRASADNVPPAFQFASQHTRQPLPEHWVTTKIPEEIIDQEVHLSRLPSPADSLLAILYYQEPRRDV